MPKVRETAPELLHRRGKTRERPIESLKDRIGSRLERRGERFRELLERPENVTFSRIKLVQFLLRGCSRSCLLLGSSCPCGLCVSELLGCTLVSSRCCFLSVSDVTGCPR